MLGLAGQSPNRTQKKDAGNRQHHRLCGSFSTGSGPIHCSLRCCFLRCALTHAAPPTVEASQILPAHIKPRTKRLSEKFWLCQGFSPGQTTSEPSSPKLASGTVLAAARLGP